MGPELATECIQSTLAKPPVKTMGTLNLAASFPLVSCAMLSYLAGSRKSIAEGAEGIEYSIAR
jgi:hypothetical protein